MLMLPLLLLGISGLLFIYQEVSRLWSKSAVQNKVVVITDAISGLGKGKLASRPLVPTPALRDKWWQGGMQARLRGRSGGQGCVLSWPLSLTSERPLLWGLQLPRLGNEEIRISGAANSQRKGQNGSAEVNCFAFLEFPEIFKCKALSWGSGLVMSPDVGAGFYHFLAGDCTSLPWISHL